MAKKKQMNSPAKTADSTAQEKPATLKDLLNGDVVSKLKAQAEQWKADDAAEKAEKRRIAEEARKVEQKRLENDFEYLLNNSSSDWRKYKD